MMLHDIALVHHRKEYKLELENSIIIMQATLWIMAYGSKGVDNLFIGGLRFHYCIAIVCVFNSYSCTSTLVCFLG